VFICEDDIVFTKPNLLLKNIRRFNKNPDIQWDVLIIGGNNCPPFQEITDYCIKVANCQTTTGYIVKNTYYQKLLDNFKEGLGRLLKDPDNKREFAIDIYWKRLQYTDNWYLLTPPTVIQLEDYSDIEDRVVKYDHLMLDLEKKWLM
jgi:GR25 family glycosyltransferase involved in LPS biosynthesis